MLALIVLVVWGGRAGKRFAPGPARRRGTNIRREDLTLPTQQRGLSPRSVKLHRPELESYLSATVSIGKPPQNFELIIDTGSSLAYVPCSWCKTCGAHMHPTRRYDPRKSETSRAVSCKSPKDCGCQSPLRCECLHRQCYYDGGARREPSAARCFGHRWGGRERHARPGELDCATRETGLISQKDGLLDEQISAAMAGRLGTRGRRLPQQARRCDGRGRQPHRLAWGPSTLARGSPGEPRAGTAEKARPPRG